MGNLNQNQLPQISEKKSTVPSVADSLTDKEKFIAACIAEINMIRQFPLDVKEVFNWTKTINRLRPNVTEEILNKVIDNFLTGEWPFDKDMGIQNIFRGIDVLSGNDSYFVPA